MLERDAAASRKEMSMQYCIPGHLIVIGFDALPKLRDRCSNGVSSCTWRTGLARPTIVSLGNSIFNSSSSLRNSLVSKVLSPVPFVHDRHDVVMSLLQAVLRIVMTAIMITSTHCQYPATCA